MGEGESVGPAAETGEEVDLRVAVEVERVDFGNVTGVYISVWEEFGLNEVTEPLNTVWVYFIVVGSHSIPKYPGPEVFHLEIHPYRGIRVTYRVM